MANSFFDNIVEKTKTFGREAWYFVSSKIFLFNFAKMMGIVAGLLFLVFWGVKCFSRHGESTKVGSYVNRNVKEVIREAEQNDFEIVITDSLYREGFPADLVLDQNPAPNSLVKEGRTIYLKITKAAGDLVQLPDIAGRDEISFYTHNLNILGVKVGRVDTVLDANLADGTIKQVLVKGQDVTTSLGGIPGIKVPQGSTVDFVISKRESDEAEVPNLIGKTADECSLFLESLGLLLGTVTPDATVTNQNTARVTKTVPVAGTMLKKGSTVDIFTTEGN
ncbi:MAG: PASTA domain-containing protein [Saprospiraceae bacterium]|nr:PASTA domain-containing protein [Saprospiraceae bacterium]